ncbi:MAG TPA: Asp23/Gls24 family envelope stress response protein [Pseudonocardia sp.]|jgi:hypothetical protein
MALDSTVQGHGLPCGGSVEEVFASAETGRWTEHQLGCEHCAVARRGVEMLNEATLALLDDPAEPPPGLLDRVMTAVRAELRRGDTLDLPALLGPASVSSQAVAVVLRWAADGVPGVRARHCRVEADPENPGAVGIRMGLSVRYESTATVPPMLDEVRRRVAAAMAGQVGLVATRVDLEMVDLWDAEPGGEST